MAIGEPHLRALAAATGAIYERNAARFDAERPRSLNELPWLEKFAALLPTGGSVLDMGCGAGEPIAAWFVARGYEVTGIDAAGAMLALVRSRLPAGEWLHSDMRTLDLGRTFDGIVGWNSFFHLEQDEQRSTLPRIADHLSPGGVLMLTVGPEQGEVIGSVGGDAVYHASLSPGEYRSVLRDQEIDVVDFRAEDPSCDGQTILLAVKRRTPRLAPAATPPSPRSS